MLGGRSAFEDNKIMVGMASSLVKIGGRNDSKCVYKLKLEGLMLTSPI